jgi:hypothetical protein
MIGRTIDKASDGKEVFMTRKTRKFNHEKGVGWFIHKAKR